MARVLVLSFRFPHPPTDGGRIRIYNLCRILAQEHTLDLLSLNEGPVSAGDLSQMASVFDEVHSFPFGAVRFKLNTIKGLPSRDPLQTYYYHFGKVQRWVDRNLPRYDLVFCFHVRMTRYLRRGVDTPRVVDFIDATSINYREAQRLARGIWRIVLPIENKRALAYELRTLGSFDKAFITSPYDKGYLERHAGRELDKLVVIPNGVRDDLLARPAAEGEEDWIVFLGTMNYAPNVDAVLYFAKEVFPQVRARLPDVRFVVVGSSPTKDVLHLAKTPGIAVTGYVEDPYAYLERAKVVVAPLRFGAGIQNKNLEAMALRRPVLTSSKGARGIAGEDGTHFVVSDEADAMARQAMELLRNHMWRRELGQRARQLVEARYRWQPIGKQLLAEVGEVLEGIPREGDV